MFYGGFPEYVPVRKRRQRAEAALARLAKKKGGADPVVIDGRAITRTFWGKAWCAHLESLRDFESRLPRGRSYVRHGAVIDLRLSPGRLDAKVSGSSLYTVAGTVAPLSPARRLRLFEECAGRIDSVVELLSGKLSKGVMEVLCDREQGVFPSAGELELECSCPDGAWLCKHLAAVLYGVGARLDSRPELLFLLRGIDQLELVGAAGSGALSSGASVENVLVGDALGEVFGIELDVGPSRPAAAAPKPPRRRVSRVAPPARKPSGAEPLVVPVSGPRRMQEAPVEIEGRPGPALPPVTRKRSKSDAHAEPRSAPPESAASPATGQRSKRAAPVEPERPAESAGPPLAGKPRRAQERAAAVPTGRRVIVPPVAVKTRPRSKLEIGEAPLPAAAESRREVPVQAPGAGRTARLRRDPAAVTLIELAALGVGPPGIRRLIRADGLLETADAGVLLRTKRFRTLLAEELARPTRRRAG